MRRSRRFVYLMQHNLWNPRRQLGAMLGMAAVLAGLFLAIRLGVWGYPLILASMAVELWIICARRDGILVTPGGFIEVYGVRLRRYRWEDVLDVVEDDGSGRLVTARGDVLLDDNVQQWRLLTARARQGLGRPPVNEPDGPPVEPEVVERWLGVEPGGKVCCETVTPWWGWLVGYALLVAGLGVLGVVTGGSGSPMVTVLAFVLPALVLGVLGGLERQRGWGRLVAHAQGIDVSGGRMVRRTGWNQLRAVRRQWQRWAVYSTVGHFWLAANTPEGRQIESAIEQALIARTQGLALPRLTAVSDAAISPMTPDTALAERGVSRPAPPEA